MSETTTAFTFAQFVLIGVFAVLTILGILFGMQLKRRRLEAEAEVAEHREAAGDIAAISPSHARPPAPSPTIETPAAADPVESIAPPPPLPSEAAPAARGGGITQLKGLGPKLAATLAQLGITRVDQIAAMNPAELAALDAQLGPFKGRPARDRWAEQARLLVAGDKAGYEAEFGRLG